MDYSKFRRSNAIDIAPEVPQPGDLPLPLHMMPIEEVLSPQEILVYNLRNANDKSRVDRVGPMQRDLGALELQALVQALMAEQAPAAFKERFQAKK